MTRVLVLGLVLLVRLLEHGSQVCDVFLIRVFPLLRRSDLFTQDVHQVTIGGRQLTFTGRLYTLFTGRLRWTFTVFIPTYIRVHQ